MLVFSVTSLSFFENVWTSTNLGPYVAFGGKNSPVESGICIKYYLHNNLCHLRITPYDAAIQHVNDTPYTAPAEKGPKIAPRAYCRHVIFSRPLFRTGLNGGLQIAYEAFCI